MKKRFLLFLLLCQYIVFGYGQSNIFFSQMLKQSPGMPAFPQRIDILIDFPEDSSTLQLSDLDLLDSVYRIAFSENNYFLYQIAINGYDDGKTLTETNNTLAQDRAGIVYNYFKNRCKSDFLIRVAPNKIVNSCLGEAKEMVRYQVPTDMNWFQINNLPEKEKTFKSTSLKGKVLMSFQSGREACIGRDTTCYVPPVDMKITASEASVSLLQGAFLRIKNTRADCPADLEFTIEEHLDFKEILDKYFLVPHEKQIIAQAG